MLDEWIAYVGRSVFRGGCFFMACAIEFDSRPGEVRDLIAELSRSWLGGATASGLSLLNDRSISRGKAAPKKAR
jgi:hypothetical protein